MDNLESSCIPDNGNCSDSFKIRIVFESVLIGVGVGYL